MPSKLQAWWWSRQGLDGSLSASPPAEVLQKTGWARSVGSSGPYLTMFSRAGTSRQRTDAAVAALEIQELPSARGCTYVVPASHYAIALKAGQGFSDESTMKTARKRRPLTSVASSMRRPERSAAPRSCDCEWMQRRTS